MSARVGAPAPAVSDALARRVLSVMWPGELLTGNVPDAGVPTLAVAVVSVGNLNTAPMASEAAGYVWAQLEGRPVVKMPAGAGLRLELGLTFPQARPVASKQGTGPSAMYHRIRTQLARSAAGGTQSSNSGVVFGFKSAGTVGLLSVTAPGFGLVGDGAGGWRWVSKAVFNGAQTESVALAWPVPVTRLAEVEFRFYPATAMQDARVELWVEGVKLIARSFAGGLLPTFAGQAGAYGDGPAYYATFRNRDGANPDLYFGPVWVDVATAELTT